MQGKGLIKIFFVLLVLVSLLQILYTVPTGKVEAEADAYAEEVVASAKQGEDSYALGRQARATYLDSMSSEEIFKIPLLQGFTYNELKNKQLNLGLDLKGGMSAVLEVDLKESLQRLSGNSKDPGFNQALNNAVAAQQNAQSDFINLFFQEYLKLPEDQKTGLARIFSRDAEIKEELAALDGLGTDDGEVIKLLRQKANETVNLTFNRLKQRIDKLGVVQPNVNLDAGRDLILVEIPGVENPERVRAFLTGTAALEFWETYRYTDAGINGAFQEANRRLAGNTENEIQFDTIMIAELNDLGNETGDSIPQVTQRAVSYTHLTLPTKRIV